MGLLIVSVCVPLAVDWRMPPLDSLRLPPLSKYRLSDVCANVMVPMLRLASTVTV